MILLLSKKAVRKDPNYFRLSFLLKIIKLSKRNSQDFRPTSNKKWWPPSRKLRAKLILLFKWSRNFGWRNHQPLWRLSKSWFLRSKNLSKLIKRKMYIVASRFFITQRKSWRKKSKENSLKLWPIYFYSCLKFQSKSGMTRNRVYLLAIAQNCKRNEIMWIQLWKISDIFLVNK